MVRQIGGSLNLQYVLVSIVDGVRSITAARRVSVWLLLAERLRSRIESRFATAGSAGLTASFGVAEMPSGRLVAGGAGGSGRRGAVRGEARRPRLRAVVGRHLRAPHTRRRHSAGKLDACHLGLTRAAVRTSSQVAMAVDLGCVQPT